MYIADNTRPPYLLAATHKKRDKIVETPTTATATKNDNPAKMNCEDIPWNTVYIYPTNDSDHATRLQQVRPMNMLRTIFY